MPKDRSALDKLLEIADELRRASKAKYAPEDEETIADNIKWHIQTIADLLRDCDLPGAIPMHESLREATIALIRRLEEHADKAKVADMVSKIVRGAPSLFAEETEHCGCRWSRKEIAGGW